MIPKLIKCDEPMIKSYKDANAEAIFNGQRPGKGFPPDLIRPARRKLIMLDAAATLDDLRNPPRSWGEIAKDNIRSGSTTSFEFALCGPGLASKMSKLPTIIEDGDHDH